MDKIRVLVIIDSLARGGRERRLIELLKGIEHISSIKIGVVVLKNVIKYPEIYELKDLELTVIERKVKKDPTVFFKIYKLSKKFRPDIIHSWGSMTSIYTFLIARVLNIKFINAMITDSICPRLSASWWRKKLTFPFSDAIVSNSMAGIIAYKVSKRKAKVIKNGFNFKRLDNLTNPDEVRKRFGIDNEFVIGMVATFSANKDYDTIIRAAELVLASGKSVKFILIGGGPNLEYYKNMVNPKWKKFILFPGSLQNIESIMQIFDVGVLTTYTEGISNSIMEYMALEKPVIATDGGGTVEIIVQNETGFIIDHGSITQLVEKIEYLFNSPEEAKSMGRQGKERIIKEFSIDRMVNQTVDLYKEVLRNKK